MSADKPKEPPVSVSKPPPAGGGTSSSGSASERPVPVMQTFHRTIANDADPFAKGPASRPSGPLKGERQP